MTLQETVKQIKERVDIVDVIARDLTLKKSGKDYVALCPFHQEKTPSFNVVPENQFAHCFGCGWHGDVFDWMQEHHRMSFFQAVRQLAYEAGIKAPQQFTTGKTAKAPNTLSHAKRKAIEEEAYIEAHILLQMWGERIAWHGISPTMRARMPDRYTKEPPILMERETEAAKKLRRALRVLYMEAPE